MTELGSIPTKSAERKTVSKFVEGFNNKTVSEINIDIVPLIEKYAEEVNCLDNDDIDEVNSVCSGLSRIVFLLPSSERIRVLLNVIPLLTAFVERKDLPLNASHYFTNMIKSCPPDLSKRNELICIIVNNPKVFSLELDFYCMKELWEILIDGITTEGLNCLRTLNALEHVVNFFSEGECEADVSVDNELIFTWNQGNRELSKGFWDIYLTLFTNIESSHSAHVIEPFLERLPLLFSNWSRLNVSARWLEVFCARMTSLGNFSLSRRFMHELLNLYYMPPLDRALQFLPKILANCFKEHRYFAIAHSKSSAKYFAEGSSFSEVHHPIFTDLRKFFSRILLGNSVLTTKRSFLLGWFECINKSRYSSPNLSFMLFSSTLDNADFTEGLRLLNTRLLNDFRETAFSHMSASENEFKFIFGLSVVKMLTCYVDHKSVELFDLMRFVENLCTNLDDSVENYLMQTLFQGVFHLVRPLYNWLEQSAKFIRRLLEQNEYDIDESKSMVVFLKFLVRYCPSEREIFPLITELKGFSDSSVGKVSSNPYVPVNRVMFSLDFIFSLLNESNHLGKWAKGCFVSKIEDIVIFFSTYPMENGINYLWRKFVNALANFGDFQVVSPSIQLAISFLQRFLTDSTSKHNKALCSMSAKMVFEISKKLPMMLDPFSATLISAFGICEGQNRMLELFQLKNSLHLSDISTLSDDLNLITENSEVLGTSAAAMSTVFVYCVKILKVPTMSNDKQSLALIQSSIEALFSQVFIIVESAEPNWREVLAEFIESFMRHEFVERYKLTELFNKVLNSLHSLSQSRHEIWQLLLLQLVNGKHCPTDIAREILFRSLLFGPVGRRLRYFVESYYAFRHLYSQQLKLKDSEEEFVKFEKIVCQQVVSASMIRLEATRILTSENHLVTPEFVESLLYLLVEDCVENVGRNYGKSKPFTNSQFHREKHRTLTAICFLLGNYGCRLPSCDNLFEKIWQLCIEVILPKETFNSVRYLAQWIIVLILSIDNTRLFFSRLLALYDKALPRQLYSLLCCYIDIMSCSNFFDRKCLHQVFDRIIPACTFNHFVTRARAQSALIRLWNTGNFSTTFNPDSDSRFLKQCVEVAAHPENKPVWRNLNNFFYQLEPLKDFESELIMHFFMPRSCDLFVDEFAFRADFEAIKLKIPENSQENCDEKWNAYENRFMVDFQPMKPDDADDLHVNMSEVANSSGIVQRKLTNWRKLLPSYDNEEFEPGECSRMRSRPCADLILVASLVDKTSNLGGLCRSADIFGLSTITLPSLDQTKDKDFQALSVSADKWLKIIEVPPNQLSKFLMSLKRDGYFLVAAEQATGSVTLPTYKFPRKCALILGNEREGIPPHILQMIDQCVEVPQHNVAVRSLNVHVTGALFMYTYSTQHAGQSTW